MLPRPAVRRSRMPAGNPRRSASGVARAGAPWPQPVQIGLPPVAFSAAARSRRAPAARCQPPAAAASTCACRRARRWPRRSVLGALFDDCGVRKGFCGESGFEARRRCRNCSHRLAHLPWMTPRRFGAPLVAPAIVCRAGRVVMSASPHLPDKSPGEPQCLRWARSGTPFPVSNAAKQLS